MGAVDYLPYAHAKSDTAVAIWNGNHQVVGHTTGANVVCELQRPNGLWYKLASANDLRHDDPQWDQLPHPGQYFSAALMNFTSGPPGYVWGACVNNTDQPGRRWPFTATATVSATVLAALIAAGVIVKRRRLRPKPLPDPTP